MDHKDLFRDLNRPFLPWVVENSENALVNIRPASATQGAMKPQSVNFQKNWWNGLCLSWKLFGVKKVPLQQSIGCTNKMLIFGKSQYYVGWWNELCLELKCFWFDLWSSSYLQKKAGTLWRSSTLDGMYSKIVFLFFHKLQCTLGPQFEGYIQVLNLS